MIKRIATALLIVSLLISVLAPVASAQTSGDRPGIFEIGQSAPTNVRIIGFKDMTPQVETTVQVQVTDLNTMQDIDKIQITVFYHGPTPPVASDVPQAGEPQTAAIMTWTRTGGWAIDGGAGSTWNINAGNSSTPDNEELSTGTWTFAFAPGKVATYSHGSGKWWAYALVTDSAGLTGDDMSHKAEMSWYGEINVAGPKEINWGSVTPGSDFADNPLAGIEVTYIANGGYDSQVRSSDTWESNGVVANLSNNENTNQMNQFALKANETNDLGGAELVKKNQGATIGTGGQTVEAGHTQSNNTFWLKLADGFEPGTYQGTITFIVANTIPGQS